MKSVYISILAGALSLTACIPKIYVIDRQTVLEDEAAGEWPEFERRLLPAGEAMVPSALPATTDHGRKERTTRLLNGNVVGSK